MAEQCLCDATATTDITRSFILLKSSKGKTRNIWRNRDQSMGSVRI